jgi:hypothetical protein
VLSLQKTPQAGNVSRQDVKHQHQAEDNKSALDWGEAVLPQVL